MAGVNQWCHCPICMIFNVIIINGKKKEMCLNVSTPSPLLFYTANKHVCWFCLGLFYYWKGHLIKIHINYFIILFYSCLFKFCIIILIKKRLLCAVKLIALHPTFSTRQLWWKIENHVGIFFVFSILPCLILYFFV